MIEIGELRTGEADAAVAIWRACHLTRPWNDPHADLAMALGSPNSTVLAGRLGGVLMATVMVGFDGHRGWVYYLAVAPDARRAGYGTAMMQAAECWLKARNAAKLNLMVRGDNAGAAGFYRAIGYAGSDVLVLQKTLGDC